MAGDMTPGMDMVEAPVHNEPEPIPIRPGSLGHLTDPTDDLDERPDEERLALVCQALQDDDQSVFRQNLIVNRFDPTGCHTIALIGRVLFRADGTKHTVADAAELVDVLAREFELVQPGLEALWPAVAARHAEVFPDEA